MWCFLKDIGFLSIVQDDDDASQLCVRARNREHLVRAFSADDYGDILETPDGDYRWRITVDRGDVMNLLMDAVDEIDYTTNVKGTIAGDDKELSKAMMSCWGAMCRYQNAEVAGDYYGWSEDADEPEDDGPVVAVVQAKRANELTSAMSDAVASISEDDE